MKKSIIRMVKIRDIIDGYMNNDEDGVVACGGNLDIRPKYQREFVYKPKERDAVIQTIKDGMPLSGMWWAKKPDGTFEVMDGQQRTISFCEYAQGNYSVKERYIHNLTPKELDNFMNYEVMVFIFEGTQKQALEWFERVNTAGAVLTKQELRNSQYTGSWLTDAKKRFSKRACAAYSLYGDYLKGSAIRQDYLETAIKWIADDLNIEGKYAIEEYMAIHQRDGTAFELWSYFKKVMEWVKDIFPEYRKEMKGIEWGYLYNTYKDESFDPEALEEEVKELMMDEDVTNKKGIYRYLLSGETNSLNVRAFSPKQKREAYEKQGGICAICGDEKFIGEMEADHKLAWSKGGKTESANCQVTCRPCNRRKSAK